MNIEPRSDDPGHVESDASRKAAQKAAKKAGKKAAKESANRRRQMGARGRR
jgi:hypothetical protein